MRQILVCPHCGFCDHIGVIAWSNILSEVTEWCPECHRDARCITIREKDDPIIIGDWTCCMTGEKSFAHLHYRIMGGAFWLEDGPTGYESFCLEYNTVEGMSEGGWCAYAGTKPGYNSEGHLIASGWDTLRISAEEMRRVFDLIARHPER